MKTQCEMSKVFCDELIELAQKDARIVQVHADLMRSCGMSAFQEKYPTRTFDVGIAEANMACIAAGLATEGFIPFACTFAVFASRRMFDQTALSIGYARQKVVIVGADPGICPEINGGSHMALEDAGLMRSLPNMQIAEPCDAAQLRALLPMLIDSPNPVYLRLFRKVAPKIYEDGVKIEWGKSIRLREGSDATVFASGIMVEQALIAADMLKKEGLSIRVENMYMLRPLDREAVLSAARDTGAIVTAENHSVNNGWGSAIAEALAEEAPVPMYRIGVRERYGEVGYIPYLLEAFGMSAGHIADALRNVIARKRES